MRVDVFKLSHHGSRANLTTELLQTVQARNYVVSTNNAVFKHPDDEALARVLVHGGEQPTLWFNYGTPRNRRWADADLQCMYRFSTEYPETDVGGVTMEI
jgi:hypothetical protein